MEATGAPLINGIKRFGVMTQLAAKLAATAIGAAVLLYLPTVAAADSKQRVRTTYSKASAPTTVGVTYPRLSAAVTPARKKARTPRLVTKTPGNGDLQLDSSAVLVADFSDGRTLFAKNTRSVTPIASITKLMTAMVVLDAELPLTEPIQIEIADFDFVKHTRSRLGMGTTLSRRELLRLALMSSENRAAAALGRAYPGGIHAFTAAMNHKAAALGMPNTRFVDSSGLSSSNVSTAQDLAKMVQAAYAYPLIREFTTTSALEVESLPGHHVQYANSNGLVRNSTWEIGLSKTGYIRQAGRCLVMQAKIAARPVIIVLLDASNSRSRTADAIRIKDWLESSPAHRV